MFLFYVSEFNLSFVKQQIEYTSYDLEKISPDAMRLKESLLRKQLYGSMASHHQISEEKNVWTF